MSLESLRIGLAQACRVLAARGVSDGILGHVSLRVDDSRLLVRCRGRSERGLAWTEPSDIRLVTHDGKAGASGELDGWSVPAELALHTEILRARPDLNAVVHAHPPAAVAADLAGLSLLPIVGAFDIPGSVLVAGGVPVYRRSVLVRDVPLGREVADVLGQRHAAVLRGHGIVTGAGSAAEAVLRAIALDRIARLSLAIAQAGATPASIPEADQAQLPDLGATFNLSTAWRHELARLTARDPQDPPDEGAALLIRELSAHLEEDKQ